MRNTMGHNDGAVELSSRICFGVFSREHVDFSLIEAEGAYVCLQMKDICALHCGVEEL